MMAAASGKTASSRVRRVYVISRKKRHAQSQRCLLALCARGSVVCWFFGLIEGEYFLRDSCMNISKRRTCTCALSDRKYFRCSLCQQCRHQQLDRRTHTHNHARHNVTVAWRSAHAPWTAGQTDEAADSGAPPHSWLQCVHCSAALYVPPLHCPHPLVACRHSHFYRFRHHR